MYKFKRILVGLDFTALDEDIIKYASFIAEHSESAEITFLKIAKNLDIPNEIKKEFPNIVENALTERNEKLGKLVSEKFRPTGNIKVGSHVILAPTPNEEFLKLVKKHNIDLIIVGMKSSLGGSGKLPLRLARRASCSLMIVPEKSKPSFQKMLVPIDFSDNAEIAVEAAIRIGKHLPGNEEIICQNVYTVPAGYHYSGKTFEEFAELMKKNAEKNYKKFIKKIDLQGQDVKPAYSQDINEDKLTDIEDLAQEIKANCIIIGLKRRSKTTSFFIGNFAERMIEAFGSKYPILIARLKHDKSGIIDALKEI